MPSHRPCALIPVYNHGRTVAAVAHGLRAQGLPCILVDDGSEPACAAVLDALGQEPGMHLVRRPANGGKGVAMQDGFHAARDLGYSHALQIEVNRGLYLDEERILRKAGFADVQQRLENALAELVTIDPVPLSDDQDRAAAAE